MFPDELVLNIYSFMNYKSQAAMRRTSKNNYRLCIDFPDGTIIKSIYAKVKKIYKMIDIEHGEPALLKNSILTLTNNFQQKNLIGDFNPLSEEGRKKRFIIQIYYTPTTKWEFFWKGGDQKILKICIKYLSKRLSEVQTRSVTEAVAIANQRLTKNPLWSYVDIRDSSY